MKHTIFLSAVLAVLVIGCSSTEPSGSFTPNNATVFFTEAIDTKATILPVTTDKTNEADIQTVMAFLKAGKSDLQPSSVQLRMVKAAKPANLVNGVGMGFKEVLLGLGARETKESRMDADQYVAETMLMYGELHQTPEDIFLVVNVQAVIKNRQSGDVAWRAGEEQTVRILPLLDGKPNEHASIEEKAALYGQSDEEIRKAVLAATAKVGRDLAQKVRNTATKWDVSPGR